MRPACPLRRLGSHLRSSEVGTPANPDAFAVISYHPNGLWSTIDHANGLTTNQTLQTHGMRRPERIYVSGPVLEGTGFDTGFCSYDGAGNVAAMGSDIFSYDDLSRLETALVHLYTQTFGYDPYGNLTSVETTPPGGSPDPVLIPVDSATNRLTGPGYDYDGSGNLTLLDGVTYSYDPMNLTRNRSGDGTQWAAIYTADDERLAIWDTAKGEVQETWTLRGLDGLVLREFFFGVGLGGQLIFADGFEHDPPLDPLCAWTQMDGTEPTCDGSGPADPTWSVHGTYVYRNGALLADVNGGDARHYHLDHLGSVRQITDDTGTVAGEHDYLPYGTEVPESSAGLRFTGHERDGHLAGSGDDLDYMHARYCSPGLGRFLSVDPVPRIGVAAQAPQIWNLYAYGTDNPLKFVDPDGLFIQLPKACSADDQCAELGFLRQTLIEAQAPRVANQLRVDKSGRVQLSSSLMRSTNSTVSRLATAANETRAGFRLSATTDDLNLSGGAKTTFDHRDNIFDIRINPKDLGNTMFLMENTSSGESGFGFLSGGEALMHEVGHFFAASGLLSNASHLSSRENADNALMYENLHRQTKGGSRALLVRNEHDVMRKADDN